jgi:hypothetical protein
MYIEFPLLGEVFHLSRGLYEGVQGQAQSTL